MTVMLSNAKKLVAEFVRFHDFDGFTGSYDRHLQGEAAVAMTGPTYRIAGTAVGLRRRNSRLDGRRSPSSCECPADVGQLRRNSTI